MGICLFMFIHWNGKHAVFTELGRCARTHPRTACQRAAGQYRCDVRERIKSFERLFEMNDMIRFTVGSRSFLMNSGGKSTQFQRSSSLQIAINPISAGQAVSCLSLYSSEWRGLRYGGWDHLIQRFQTVLKKTTWPTVSYYYNFGACQRALKYSKLLILLYVWGRGERTYHFY